MSCIKSGGWVLRSSLCVSLLLLGAITAHAGPLIGIMETVPGSLPNGPYTGDSGLGTAPPRDISIEGEGMLDPDPSKIWNKDIIWDYSNHSLNPGDTLCIMETITLWSPPSSSGSTDNRLELADWHEMLAGGSLPLGWDPNSPALLSARVGASPIQLDVEVGFSDDLREIWFKFDPLKPGPFGAPIEVPITLEITKYLVYLGDIPITSGGGQASTEVRIMQQPSETPEPTTALLCLLGSCVTLARRRR